MRGKKFLTKIAVGFGFEPLELKTGLGWLERPYGTLSRDLVRLSRVTKPMLVIVRACA